MNSICCEALLLKKTIQQECLFWGRGGVLHICMFLTSLSCLSDYECESLLSLQCQLLQQKEEKEIRSRKTNKSLSGFSSFLPLSQ